MTDAPGGDRVADAARRNLVDDLAPESFRPYLRLARIDRPIGWWLLLLPCWWSAALAAIAAGKPWPDPWHVALFYVGAVAMRGAGSTYNDLVDRHLDARVARTMRRPLPSGAVSLRAAIVFLLAQALIGLAVLLQFNAFTIGLGILSLLPVAIYPAMKRVTHFPQIVLGIAFAWGGLMGWAAAFGRLDAPALLIYAAAIAWTFGYDTIYAMQDIEDDALVGIRSTARFFGENVRIAVAVAYGVAVLLAAGAVWTVGGGWFAAAGVAGVAAHLAWQVATLRASDADLALRLFRSNRDVGLWLFAAFTADAFVGARG